MAASTMWSGVRKSGWPMPRLMMSRPCAASALARASTAKAFSSPMRSKAAMVRSMVFSRAGSLTPNLPNGAFPRKRQSRGHVSDLHFAALGSPPSRGRAGCGAMASGFALVVASDLQFRHAHHLEDDGDRPADQQKPVERGDRPDQAAALGGNRITVAKRRVVLE